MPLYIFKFCVSLCFQNKHQKIRVFNLLCFNLRKNVLYWEVLDIVGSKFQVVKKWPLYVVFVWRPFFWSTYTRAPLVKFVYNLAHTFEEKVLDFCQVHAKTFVSLCLFSVYETFRKIVVNFSRRYVEVLYFRYQKCSICHIFS